MLLQSIKNHEWNTGIFRPTNKSNSNFEGKWKHEEFHLFTIRECEMSYNTIYAVYKIGKVSLEIRAE